MKKDVCISKSGEKITVSMQTVKSKKIINLSKFPQQFEIESEQVPSIFSWAISHGLTIDSEIPLTIKQK